MPYTMEDFKRDYIKENLDALPPDERLRGLSADEVLRSFSADEIKSYLKTCS